jgi:hypothetical protein
MLSAADLSAAQGEEPTEAQGSEHFVGGLSMSQCFYRLPTFAKSVNLEVVRAAEGSAPDAIKAYWHRHFGPDAIREGERVRVLKEKGERAREEMLKRERESGQVREGGHADEEKEGDEEQSRPRRVGGVGEEAYWSGSRTTAALNVLSGGTVVRLSLGGPEEESAKIRKASELARKVLKQL